MSPPSAEESVEVVVVGAGFAGLAAAKGYIQCAPESRLVILDPNKTIGGTWAKERLYAGLHSNNLRGTLEFPDYPLHEGYGVKDGEHLPGAVVHQYLTDYAKHWGIYDSIRFESTADEAEKVNSEKRKGWRLTVRTPNGDYKLFTEKLIVATGLTSQPQPMHVKGQEAFNAPVVNTSQFAKDAVKVLEDPEIKRVTIFGGGKSAYDAVYLFARKGKEIDWIIRKAGHGPIWIAASHIVIGPLGKFWLELLVTRRILAWMSPCLWGGGDGSQGWRHFLHQTWLGRKIVDTFWWKLGSDALEQAGFNSNPKLKVLHPECSVYETATSFSILTYPTDILDFVRSGQVEVHREDLSHLSDHTVHLSNGTSLPTDAFVASTGWQFGPAITFKDTDLHSDLGIPSLDYTNSQKAFWTDLDKKADAEVFRRWPQLAKLKHPPRATEGLREHPLDDIDSSIAQREYQPWRLYRSLAPPGLAAKGDRSLAFAGFSSSINNPIRNELAGTWMYAYMNDKLTIDPCRDVDDVYWDAALLQRFCMRRYPYSFGRRYPDYIFDAVPFFDTLLGDLGISGLRKGGSWHRECFEPYGMADYRGVTAEWLDKRRLVGKEKLR